jgi:hypothetical protein
MSFLMSRLRVHSMQRDLRVRLAEVPIVPITRSGDRHRGR